MALTYRFYRAERTGDGLSLKTAFRSALSDYIVEDGSGATFHDEIGSGLVRYALARCDSAVHTTIGLDARIQALSPQFTLSAAATMFLNGDAVLTLPTTVKNFLISDGKAVTGTVRQTLSFLLAIVPPSVVIL